MSKKISRQELSLQIGLGNSLTVTKGQSAPEVKQAFSRARDLSRQISISGSTAEAAEEACRLIPVPYDLWLFYRARAEHQTTF